MSENIDVTSDDNDYIGGDEVLDYDEAAELLEHMGEVTDDMKSRLTFVISHASKNIRGPVYWEVFIDHKKIGSIYDRIKNVPMPELSLTMETYFAEMPLRTEEEARALGTDAEDWVYSHDEHWYNYDGSGELYCGDAYFPSFATLQDLITFTQENK